MNRDVKTIIQAIRDSANKVSDEAHLKEDSIDRAIAYESSQVLREMAHGIEMAFLERDHPEAKVAHEERRACGIVWCAHCYRDAVDIPED